jgi:hypothetical protein
MPSISLTVRLDHCDTSFTLLRSSTHVEVHTHWLEACGAFRCPTTHLQRCADSRAGLASHACITYHTKREWPRGPHIERSSDRQEKATMHSTCRQQEKSDPTQHRSIPMRSCMGARRLHRCTTTPSPKAAGPTSPCAWQHFPHCSRELLHAPQRSLLVMLCCSFTLLTFSCSRFVNMVLDRTHLNSSHQVVVGNARKFSYVLALSWPTDSSRCTHASFSFDSRTDVFCAVTPAPCIFSHKLSRQLPAFVTQAVTPAACICHICCHASTLHLSHRLSRQLPAFVTQAVTALAIGVDSLHAAQRDSF